MRVANDVGNEVTEWFLTNEVHKKINCIYKVAVYLSGVFFFRYAAFLTSKLYDNPFLLDTMTGSGLNQIFVRRFLCIWDKCSPRIAEQDLTRYWTLNR